MYSIRLAFACLLLVFVVSSAYKYEVDQCMGDDIKNHRTICCSDMEMPVMGGIDVVNLFFQEPDTMPIMGDDSIAVYLPTSTGFYKFLFSSESNRDLFIQDPWHYAPTWGGYCAYGIALEDKAYDPTYVEKLGPFIDLSQWTVYNDRLYFFGGAGPKMKFLAAGDEVLELGNTNWGSYYDGEIFDGHFDTNCFHRQTYEDLLAGKVTGDA
mmetsp:Transcript_24344/g.41851  ORF Transcript_24344/g.41851 Transcript_24344/m.41851 type:complete len:210 (-) Transcript_24344:41-670(-)